jgi:hypothetical protein
MKTDNKPRKRKWTIIFVSSISLSFLFNKIKRQKNQAICCRNRIEIKKESSHEESFYYVDLKCLNNSTLLFVLWGIFEMIDWKVDHEHTEMRRINFIFRERHREIWSITNLYKFSSTLKQSRCLRAISTHLYLKVIWSKQETTVGTQISSWYPIETVNKNWNIS